MGSGTGRCVRRHVEAHAAHESVRKRKSIAGKGRVQPSVDQFLSLKRIKATVYALYNWSDPWPSPEYISYSHLCIVGLISSFFQIVLRPGLVSKNFHRKLSHQILRHMHEVLNID